jgi:hypothetical protein
MRGLKMGPLPIALGLLSLTLAAAQPEASNLPDLSCRGSEGAPTECIASDSTINLRVAGTYRAGFFNISASEGLAYDAAMRRLFVANAATQSIDVISLDGVLDATAPPALPPQFSIRVADLLPALPSPPGSSDPRHGAVPRAVAVGSKGLLAVVLQHVETPNLPGKLAFFTTGAGSGATPIALLDTGSMPNMAAFTGDGNYLVVANEGEPSDDYLTDPPGSVTIISLREGAGSAAAAEVGFQAFDTAKDRLTEEGVRISGPNLATPDPMDTASVAVDLEPEHVAISPDSQFAWVTLPENNAVAVLDIARQRFLAILPFGYKDHLQDGNGFDGSDGDRVINIETWPVRGMYMPSQAAVYEFHRLPLLVYGNEGTRRLLRAWADEVRIKDIPDAAFDPVAFPNSAELKRDDAIGPLKVSGVDGDIDDDGDFDHLYAFGARSFSIRLPDNTLLFDSGDDFEQITAEAMRQTGGYFLFNTPDDENRFDDTSDLRGPEPVAVAVGKVGRRSYAFIGLERVGGVMLYDITNPLKPKFQHYINNRNFAVNAKEVCEIGVPENEICRKAGDLSAEDLLFVGSEESPTSMPLLIVSNETSGTATVFELSEVR